MSDEVGRYLLDFTGNHSVLVQLRHRSDDDGGPSLSTAIGEAEIADFLQAAGRVLLRLGPQVGSISRTTI